MVRSRSMSRPRVACSAMRSDRIGGRAICLNLDVAHAGGGHGRGTRRRVDPLESRASRLALLAIQARSGVDHPRRIERKTARRGVVPGDDRGASRPEADFNKTTTVDGRKSNHMLAGRWHPDDRRQGGCFGPLKGPGPGPARSAMCAFWTLPRVRRTGSAGRPDRWLAENDRTLTQRA